MGLAGEWRMECALTIADRGIRTDAEGRYCLNDLHRAAGEEARHRPGYWLELDQTKALAAEIEKAGIPAIWKRPRVGTFVARELVYAFAMWISPAFHLEVIRSFDSLARGGAQQDVQVALSDPFVLRRLLAGQAERVIALEHEAAARAPRAAAYDRLTDQRGALSLTAAAKALGISPHQFFRWLSIEKWIYRSADHGSWLAHQRQIGAGYLIHRLHPVEHSPGYERIHPQVLVTASGVAKLALLLEQAAASIHTPDLPMR